LRSTSLSGADPALEGLEWSHLLPLLGTERSAARSSDHAVLVGRPPDRPWDQHCVEHKQEECSRLVLVDLRTLTLVGAGTEVAGRIVGVEVLDSSSRSADLLAYAEGPQTFARLTITLPPLNDKSTGPASLQQAPATSEQGVSSKVDALKEFFQRGGSKDRSVGDSAHAGDGVDEQAGHASWSGKTLPIAEDPLRINLGPVRGLRVLDKLGGIERVVVWGDYGFEVRDLPTARKRPLSCKLTSSDCLPSQVAVLKDGQASVVARQEVDLFDVIPGPQGSLALTGPDGDAVYTIGDATASDSAPSVASDLPGMPRPLTHTAYLLQRSVLALH
jgi:hypothetical protein